jgi:hypothetical protein
VKAANAMGGTKAYLLTVGMVSVVLAWGVVHTIFTLRYARIYYTGGDGGVDFNEKIPPDYTDFAYLAFTIGMTFQVSDTNLTSKSMRRTALRHALISYLFGAASSGSLSMWSRASFTETCWCPLKRDNLDKEVPLTMHRVDDQTTSSHQRNPV